MSLYPEEFDTEENLYAVHDALRVKLAEDYTPGDTTISIIGDEEIIRRFPETGIITLTEQCSDIDDRAISFTYGLRTLDTTLNDNGLATGTFELLELLSEFEDVEKPKLITNVTQNVMAVHHNAIKDAVIAIEEFVGVKDEVADRPLEGTMEERINYLRNLVLAPKAWFSVDRTIGLVPLTVEFTDLSFRLGTDGTSDEITYLWDFGDNSSASMVSIITVADEVPTEATNVLVTDSDGGTILKTYTTPGIYDVSLTVTNDFGTDTVVLPAIVNARVAAPSTAVIDFTPRSNQILTAGEPTGGPYTTTPILRTPINSLIDIEIADGVNDNTGLSYSGEVLDENNNAIDPIINYTWSLADDLLHGNSKSTRASYSIGGLYDIILRADTSFGAYRITTYEDSIDVVEKTNLWLWTINGANDIQANEFGLISETFKIKSNATYEINKDSSFLDGENNEEQLKREFDRNNGFAARGTTLSGDGGVGLLFWAGGRTDSQLPTAEQIYFTEYNGFADTYVTRDPISRPWNWISLVSSSNAYFFLGGSNSAIPINTSPTNQDKHKLNLVDLSVTSSTFSSSNYKNGANELTENVVTYDDDGLPTHGHMSVYRTTWKDSTGYILRNDGIGNFFRIKSFYKTSGTIAEPFQDIRKLTDMSGPAKLEGQLVTLSSGVFFFNNSGSMSAYNDTSGVWETGGPGVNSASFRLLQDSSVVGFDNSTQTLLAASDGDRRAYLSYDYSENAFIKFNEADLTFSSMGSRIDGDQWQIQVF